jgi:hypothetical protein
METRVKSSTSINNLRLSDQESTTNHGTSEAVERPVTCKSGAQILDGGSCSVMKEDSSPTCGIIEYLMFTKEKMLKPKRLTSGSDMEERTRSGMYDI